MSPQILQKSRSHLKHFMRDMKHVPCWGPTNLAPSELHALVLNLRLLMS